MRRSLIGSEARFLMVGFLWGPLIGHCQKWCPDDRIREKLFTESDPGAKWAKLWVKSIKTLFEFVKKLFNLDDKVFWSFLTLIAKNKLDEKGTLSLINIGVPFLMNALILHIDNCLWAMFIVCLDMCVCGLYKCIITWIRTLVSSKFRLTLHKKTNVFVSTSLMKYYHLNNIIDSSFYFPPLISVTSRNSDTPKKFFLHPCLASEASETQFLREMVEVMLVLVLPRHISGFETARHLLREIITCTGIESMCYYVVYVVLKVDPIPKERCCILIIIRGLKVWLRKLLCAKCTSLEHMLISCTILTLKVIRSLLYL